MYMTMRLQAVLEQLQVEPAQGLSSAQVKLRRESGGENKLREDKPEGFWQLFLLQLKDTMVLILLFAAAVSFLLALFAGTGEFTDPILILAIVLVNALIGAWQEYGAYRALEALKSLSAPTVAVLRNGKKVCIPASELVCGDILYLTAGDLVAADARLIECVGLQTDEAALTGESTSVIKDAAHLCSTEGNIADAKNMVWASTVVTAGHGCAVVTAIGMQTQVGKIADMLQRGKPPLTPLQEKLSRTGKLLGAAALGICALIFVLGLLRGFAFAELFLTSVSLAVAAIPEGLPTVVTILLATGMRAMASKNAIVRKLPAVETLGSATVICTDKTGTLTQNKMTVTQVYGNRDLVLDLAALCCNESGATERAICRAAQENGFVRETMERAFARVRELPFSSENKYMLTVHQFSGGYRVIMKGAADVVLRCCSLSTAARNEFAQESASMAGQALRVLAVAYKDVADLSAATATQLKLAGLIGMTDPPRPEAAEAVRLCKQAGIRPIMITGDHAETACAIAKQVGIFSAGDRVMTGVQLDALSEQALADSIDNCSVFARVTPAHKVKIVRALQLRRAVVAMTGDGVNDAPALRMADIGCAMGKSGTDVAKAAADLVLTDDRFSTVVSAVRAGRAIYDNIRKAVHFLLSSNIGEVLTVFFAMFVGWPAPLAAVHLLWVNFVTDALPAIALGFEAPEPDIMQRRPLGRGQSLFSDGAGFSVLIEGIMIGTLALIAFSFGNSLYGSLPVAQTMAFCVLSLSQLVHAYNMRSTHSVLQSGIFANKKLNLACALGACLQVAVVVFAPLRALFATAPLNFSQWCLVAILSLLPLGMVELEKWIKVKEHHQPELVKR